MKLDRRDLIILKELDTNGRIPASQIAKKIRLSKTATVQRISKLEKLGFIRGYYTVIDSFKLGYVSFRIYIKFHNTSPQIERGILDWLKVNPNVWWVGKIQGSWDIGWLCWSRNLYDFKKLWSVFLTLFKKYVVDFVITPYLRFRNYHKEYLIKKKIGLGRSVVIVGGSSTVSIDETDRKILQIISSRARLPIVHIAKLTGLSYTVVKYRLKQMKKSGVIQGFRADVNFRKLGYSQFKIDFQLNDLSMIDGFIKFLEAIPNLIYIDETVGYADLEATFDLKSQQQLEEILSKIKSKWHKKIHKIDYFVYTDVLKQAYFSEI